MPPPRFSQIDRSSSEEVRMYLTDSVEQWSFLDSKGIVTQRLHKVCRWKRAYLKEIWACGYLDPCAHETDNMTHGEPPEHKRSLLLEVLGAWAECEEPRHSTRLSSRSEWYMPDCSPELPQTCDRCKLPLVLPPVSASTFESTSWLPDLPLLHDASGET